MVSDRTDQIHQIVFEGTEKMHLQLKWLCSLLFLTSFFMGTFLISVAVLYNKENTCLTRGCLTSASKTLQYLNTRVNACDDFYEFACGNYLRDTVIPDDETEVSTFSRIQATVQNQLRTILQNPNLQNGSKPYRFLGRLYNLCMNTADIQRQGLNYAKYLIKHLGGWPLLDQHWNESQFDWIQLMHNLRKNGLEYNHFIQVRVESDRKNSSRRVLYIDQTLPKWNENLVRKSASIMDGYYNYILDIAESFGANKSNVSIQVDEIIEFERYLAMMYVPPENCKNCTMLYNPITIGQLQRKIPAIDWLRYVNNAVNNPRIKIAEDEVIVLSNIAHFVLLSDLLHKTPKRVQANYIITKTMLNIVQYLTDELLNKQEQFYRALTGVLFKKPRWKMCLETVSQSLRIPLSALYVKKYFKHDSINKTKQIIRSVQEEFTKILKRVDWLDDNTRKHALEKVSFIASAVGYPHELLDDKNIEQYHDKLGMSETHFLKAIMNVSLFNENWEYEKLRNSVDRQDWVEHSTFLTEVNAFYCVEENSIEFPAAILQDVFFDSERPNYMNYGSLGFVVGHEITHGFDDQGKQFDKDGNLNQWWTTETEAAFNNKSQCFIDQYSNYLEPNVDMYVNGLNTIGENIADNGGIKAAYLAYKNWAKKNGAELKLPGFDYTPYQMFWISAAQLWCFKSRKEIISQRVSSDVHSPPKFRVIGSFSNSEQFSRDFNCPSNSNMNPKNKCCVW